MEERRKRIREQVLLIAGYEETIRMAMAEGDKEMQKVLEDCKKSAYKRLKAIVYGTTK